MSIRKRKWTTSQGVEKEAWVVDYVDQNGKRHLKTFDRKKVAEEFSSKAHVEVIGRVHVADADTVSVEVAGSLWMASCEASGLERSTLNQYRQHLTLHIMPLVGQEKLTRITVPFVRSFLDQLRASGRSEAMVRNVRVSFGSLLSDAQERGLIVRNAVKEMGRERRGRVKHEQRHKERLEAGVDIPTPDEVRQILKTAKGRDRVFLLTAVFTGMRASELRGLRWADLDFAKAEVTVRQRADAFQAIGSPKSKAGRRNIPLISELVRLLREWKLACPKGELGLVFPNGEGNVEWHANIVKRWLMPPQLAAGVTRRETGFDGGTILLAKYPGMHALRHFYASWCINRPEDGGLGLPPKVVQERMGHSSIQVTLDTYGHLFPRGDGPKAMDAAASALLA